MATTNQAQQVIICTRPAPSPDPCCICCVHTWHCVFQCLNIYCAITCLFIGDLLCGIVWYIGVPLLILGLLLLCASVWVCHKVMRRKNEGQVIYVTGATSAQMGSTVQAVYITEMVVAPENTFGHASSTSRQVPAYEGANANDREPPPYTAYTGSLPSGQGYQLYPAEPPPPYENTVNQSQEPMPPSETLSAPPIEEIG